MKNSSLASNGSRSHCGQRGAILVVSLMFLIILTLISISAMNTTTFEEKMSGSSRDWNVAFAAAEAAIRDAEYDITAKTLPGYTASARSLYGMTGFGDETDVENGTCSINTGSLKEGLCRRTAAKGTSTLPTFSSTDTRSVVYGTFTGAGSGGANYPIKGVAQQPRYFVTAWQEVTPYDAGGTFFYEITARGFGANPNTQVTLREVFRRPQ